MGQGKAAQPLPGSPQIPILQQLFFYYTPEGEVSHLLGCPLSQCDPLSGAGVAGGPWSTPVHQRNSPPCSYGMWLLETAPHQPLYH